MNTETLTSRLHARADSKLKAYCDSKFGSLFKECGEHNAKRQDVTPELKSCSVQLGIKEPEKFPWHGAVWAYAEEVLFLMLRDEWRNTEVSEFMAKIESTQADIQQLMEGQSQ